MDAEQSHIWKTIVDANQAWVTGYPERIGALFADDAVAVQPNFGERMAGRELIARSFVDYCRFAKTIHFEHGPPDVDVFGPTAVVSYGFQIRFQMKGKSEVLQEEGRELMVLTKQHGAWRIVWRTHLALPYDAEIPAVSPPEKPLVKSATRPSPPAAVAAGHAGVKIKIEEEPPLPEP